MDAHFRVTGFPDSDRSCDSSPSFTAPPRMEYDIFRIFVNRVTWNHGIRLVAIAHPADAPRFPSWPPQAECAHAGSAQ
jgi:hypothetical protein